MRWLKRIDSRLLFTAGFSFFSAYLLAFLFEGRVFYSLSELYAVDSSTYLLAAIVAHFAGLVSCAYFLKLLRKPRRVVLGGMGFSLLATVFFFFKPAVYWLAGMIVGGYASGCVVASLGFFLKALIPKGSRMKTCADILIFSNVFMIAINIVAVNVSPYIGLVLALASVVLGMLSIRALPLESESGHSSGKSEKHFGDVGRPLLLLALFILLITINSGLMYQVINPAFGHLAGLASWYWAVPYIAALIAMRQLPASVKRSNALYVGMFMNIAAFISFMLLGRKGPDYIVVNTLLLGACGIFDLFWWSILGEMLNYTNEPVGIFGLGLASNVLGVLIGDLIGIRVTSAQLAGAEVAVIALTVASVTLVLLPVLNRHLVRLLKSHAYLAAYDRLSKPQRRSLFGQAAALDPLTAREEEVLELLLDGKSNRKIGEELFISETTVKTHVRNIFSKYDVRSRAELISTLLKNQLSG